MQIVLIGLLAVGVFFFLKSQMSEPITKASNAVGGNELTNRGGISNQFNGIINQFRKGGAPQ